MAGNGSKWTLRLLIALVSLTVFAGICVGCDGEGTGPTGDDDTHVPSDIADTEDGEGDAADDGGVDTGSPPVEDVRETDVDTAPPDLPIEDLAVIENPRNALSFYVEWSTPRPASTQLDVECGDTWSQTYEGDAERTDHRVFVMGLWGGASCSATARSTTSKGAEGSETKTFEVGAAPSFLPDLEVKTRKKDAIQPGWTLANVWNAFDSVPLTVGIFDAQGRFRWYHQLNTSNSGSDTDVRVFQNKVLIGGNRRHVGPRLVNWQGEVVWKESFRMHHDIRPTSDGEHLLYLTHAARCPQDYASDTIVEFDWKNDEEAWRSDFCNFYTPPSDALRHDWSHLNTIVTFPGESNLLVSARNQHSLFKIDPDQEKLIWKMGVRGDFGLSGEELFYRQHAPEIQSDGNILLFDNGAYPQYQDRPWSRVVEISYDTSSMDAEIVWKYRPDPDIFTPIWGDADRLSNGNTLATFGHRNKDPERNSQIIEVTSDKTEVWHVEMPNKWGWYRSERLAEPPVGRVLEP